MATLNLMPCFVCKFHSQLFLFPFILLFMNSMSPPPLFPLTQLSCFVGWFFFSFVKLRFYVFEKLTAKKISFLLYGFLAAQSSTHNLHSEWHFLHCKKIFNLLELFRVTICSHTHTRRLLPWNCKKGEIKNEIIVFEMYLCWKFPQRLAIAFFIIKKSDQYSHTDLCGRCLKSKNKI